jgi:zinc D-Ala-D-Ala carboxypeptidase
MSDIWDTIVHFSPDEFDSADAPGSGRRMNVEFVKLLDLLRDRIGKPIHISSGFRTEERNQIVGGKPHSAHTKGCAVDIDCWGSDDRFKIVSWALELGIKRIGIGESFVHLDMDFDKPQDCIWLYPTGYKG